jgi:hypothetical protein
MQFGQALAQTAPEQIAASSLPPAMPYHEAVLALCSTTRMSPKEIPDLGVAEVAHIGKEMDATVAATGFKGTRAEFQKPTTAIGDSSTPIAKICSRAIAISQSVPTPSCRACCRTPPASLRHSRHATGGRG